MAQGSVGAPDKNKKEINHGLLSKQAVKSHAEIIDKDSNINGMMPCIATSKTKNIGPVSKPKSRLGFYVITNWNLV